MITVPLVKLTVISSHQVGSESACRIRPQRETKWKKTLGAEIIVHSAGFLRSVIEVMPSGLFTYLNSHLYSCSDFKKRYHQLKSDSSLFFPSNNMFLV